MTRAQMIVKLKQAVIPYLIVFFTGVLATLVVEEFSSEPSSIGLQHSAKDDKASPSMAGRENNEIGADQTLSSASNRLAGITVVIANNGKTVPLGIKVGGKYLSFPDPASWPRGADGDAPSSEPKKFLAGIIDTAGVLRANGFQPDEAFSLVVGGAELNAANTFRIEGNNQADKTQDQGNDYALEYRTQPGDGGIWRYLKFRNIVLSYGQVPSLADYLVSQNGAASSGAGMNDTRNATVTPQTVQMEASAHSTAQVTPLEQPSTESARKDIEALDSPDPAIRADAIQNLILSGYNEATAKEAGVKIGTIIDKTLQDSNPNVREATLDSLDGYDGPIPQDALSRAALNDKNPALRIHALELLAERFGDRASPTVKEALHDPDPRVGRMASQLLSDFADKQQQQ